MDSLTQFVLGSGVAVATLGPVIGPRRAALLGGVLGTVPDLDVLYQFDNPIDAFTLHRGPTHSFIIQALAAPVFGAVCAIGAKALNRSYNLSWVRASLAVFLIFATHAIIDAMTIYGTRLFWPIFPDPLGVGSLFIIDPLYTLPLLGVTIWALCRVEWSARLQRMTITALIATTSYGAWSIWAQSMALKRAEHAFAEAGLEVNATLALAAPFNTVSWKVIGLTETSYVNAYLSFFGDEVALHEHPRGQEYLEVLRENESYNRLYDFADGFVSVRQEPEGLVVSDLRMGMTPNYVFQYSVADSAGNAVAPLKYAGERVEDSDVSWLWNLITGKQAMRPAEQEHVLKMPSLG